MGKAKPQPAKGDDAANLILSYLHKQNRPYSVTDITNNLHNAITKSSAQKILQQLVDAGGVSCKTQGKQSIYVIRQDDTEMATQEELVGMDSTIEALKGQITAAREELKNLNSAHTAITMSLPTDEIRARLTALDNEINTLNDVLCPLKAGTLPLPTKEEQEQIKKDLREIRKTYNSRRAIVPPRTPPRSSLYGGGLMKFNNMAGMLIEGVGKSRYEELAERLGIEGDDEDFLLALKNDEAAAR